MKARRVKKLDPDRPLAENAARIVRVRLEELRSFAPKALVPAAVEDQHDMRIAAKRLRYVLELTGFCFGEPAAAARRQAKDLQGILGDMHDCDVMLPRVREQRNRTPYVDLAALIAFLEARRDQHFARFRERWREQEAAGTWEELDRAVRREIGLAKERRRAERDVQRARRKIERAERAEVEARERAARAEASMARSGPHRSGA